jgi:hypothetical protein
MLATALTFVSAARQTNSVGCAELDAEYGDVDIDAMGNNDPTPQWPAFLNQYTCQCTFIEH